MIKGRLPVHCADTLWLATCFLRSGTQCPQQLWDFFSQNMGFEPQPSLWCDKTLTTWPKRHGVNHCGKVAYLNCCVAERATYLPSLKCWVKTHSHVDGILCPLHLSNYATSSRGRVVKATDSKSVSLWEHRFESCQLRQRLFLDDIINSSTAFFGQQPPIPR